MNKLLKAAIIACITLASMPTSGKTKCTPIYIFGTSASFIDSLVYITDIQILDDAWIDDKSNFLLKRNEYSNQLRNYFTQQGQPSRTCLIEYATKEKKILKKYARLRKKLKGTKKHPKNYDIREVDEEEFKFSAVLPDAADSEDMTVSKKDKKRAEKSKAKKSRGGFKDNGRPSTSPDADDAPPSMPRRH